MTMHAYNESYLDDAMINLGDMFDYAVREMHYEGDTFFSWFIDSGIAHQIENANPKYIAGMSGIELTIKVLEAMHISMEPPHTRIRDADGMEYWAGWILAYYQWESGLSFSKIKDGGLTYSKITSMYILHEADVSKFVEAADHVLSSVYS